MSTGLPTLARLFLSAYEAHGRPALTGLAARARVGRVTLSRWLNGHQPPSAEELERVLAILGYELTIRKIDPPPEKT